jgi:hypothetical protein
MRSGELPVPFGTGGTDVEADVHTNTVEGYFSIFRRGMKGIYMVERLMRAANDGAIKLYTSTITIAEVVHIGEKPPPSDLKPYIERLILSGRNGIIAVAPSPQIVLLARDLAGTDDLFPKGAADKGKV